MTSTTHYEYETSLAAVGRTELVRRLILARGRVQTLVQKLADVTDDRSRLRAENRRLRSDLDRIKAILEASQRREK